MAQKLLKAGRKRKTAAKRSAKKTEDGSVVLVGTYREKQLDWVKKNGVCNYPVKDENDGELLFVNIRLTINCYNFGSFNKRGEMVYYPNIWKG